MCLTAIPRISRRPLPSGLGAPGDQPAAALPAQAPEVPWLQPIPDVLFGAEPTDPAAIAVSREGMRLAFIAALQYLPARPRAADEVAEPAEPARRALLDRYATAFQDADVTALADLLREDVVMEMPPHRVWFADRADVTRFLATHILTAPGRLLMIPAAANGQPALAVYERDPDGTYRWHAI